MSGETYVDPAQFKPHLKDQRLAPEMARAVGEVAKIHESHIIGIGIRKDRQNEFHLLVTVKWQAGIGITRSVVDAAVGDHPWYIDFTFGEYVTKDNDSKRVCMLTLVFDERRMRSADDIGMPSGKRRRI